MDRIQKWAAGGMACGVIIGTGLALIRPGWTLEQLCTLAEHTHRESCYSQVTEIPQTLHCSFPIHSHSDSCLDADGQQSCGTADFVIHSHDDFCLDSSGMPACPLPEIRVHLHSPDCGEDCTLPELSPHVHSEEAGCYAYEDETLLLICQQQELTRHQHEEDCFVPGEAIVTQILTCDQAEHIHNDECSPADTASVITALEAAALTLSEEAEIQPLEQTQASSSAREDDLSVVTGDGIRFRLFNYSLDINKTSDGSQWRDISTYFTFRNSSLTKGDTPSDTVHIPPWNINSTYDADGFTDGHATVEWHLTNGLPVLSLTRNPDPEGESRADPGLDAATRSLAYLFSSGDHAVTAYSPANTILQRSGNRYYYNSETNAVDYDPDANVFRLRSYAERNSTTAGYSKSDGSLYGDFLPFTYTDGQVVGHNGTTDYHTASADADYWFGMTMEVDFFQTKDGQIDGTDMIFRFSGDDDVWVFVDDVLVLDLGGTHGTATGSINFATGEITQYLSWNGGTADSAGTSFPTTIRSCFDSAGAAPAGGWNDAGTSFADYTKHTLKFFYLERGAAVANCLLDFRLPTLPDKSLTVSKDLIPSVNTDVTAFLSDTLSYQFRVVKADADGAPTEELFLKPGTVYTLLSPDQTEQTGTVSADGTFSLKAGQSAQFTDMLTKGGGAVDYIVQEILPSQLAGQYGGVEYQVSGDTGSVETETGSVQEFTAFNTEVLSAEITQTVTYRNKVDISQLSTLKLTKLAAPAAEFADGQFFSIQVTLGGEPLPTGTGYQVDGESRTVTEPGIVELTLGQTAVLDGILSGTAYEVTELGTAQGGFNAAYSGTVTGGTVNCTADGASGEFPLNSTVHITVTNANYDFSASIDIWKQALDNEATAVFRFPVEEVQQQEDGSWAVVRSLPGTSITVSDSALHAGTVTIGFDTGTEGVFHYRIREQQGTGDFLYDGSYYILELTVTDGTAAVTGILKNGTEDADRILFTNRRTTRLLVTKEVTGAVCQSSFPFSVTVTLEDSPFALPQPAADAQYTVSGNVITFDLAHGEAVSIPGIPCNAVVTVSETGHEGFSASYQVEGQGEEHIPGDSVCVSFGSSPETVHFRNNGGYTLPDTGSTGIYGISSCGLLLCAASLLSKIRRREGSH